MVATALCIHRLWGRTDGIYWGRRLDRGSLDCGCIAGQLGVGNVGKVGSCAPHPLQPNRKLSPLMSTDNYFITSIQSKEMLSMRKECCRVRACLLHSLLIGWLGADSRSNACFLFNLFQCYKFELNLGQILYI